MTLESKPIRKNNQTPAAGRESHVQTDQSDPNIPRGFCISPSPPTETHCQITCKTEKSFWDNVKTGAEILGIVLLGIYTGYTIKMYYANKEAADAAKSAAETAKDALHISQRAYLTDGASSINFPTKSITIPIINSGHIPSGALEVVVHETTVNIPVPMTGDIDLRAAIERHWGRYKFQSIPPGWPIAIAIPVPQMSDVYLNSGQQTVILAGFIAYNDGFPGTAEQNWPFCQRTTYQTVMKRFFIGPCRPGDDTLHKLESLDGYPNNPEQ